MKHIIITETGLTVSNILLGCYRLARLNRQEAEALIRTAMDEGINFFDHADRYGKGACETLFSEAIRMDANIREKMILQSKCGIHGSYFDFSKEHILQAVDGSLKRLRTDYLDILLLHRPDMLMEPEEVADAFNILHFNGKVRYFGVSNFNPMQIELLQKYVPFKLVVNQLQLSVVHTPMIDSGIAVNMHIDQAFNRDGSVLDYCRLKDITIQAWSPFQKGFIEGPFFEDEKYRDLMLVLERIANKYSVPVSAVAVGWITRHPANIQVILGSTKPHRIIEGCRGSELPLSREEWYEIYQAAGNMIP
jgi:predicted oxidoreductase